MPLVPGGRVGQARQHQMDDVLGQVVLAGGDEDLGAGDAVAAVAAAARPGADQAEVGAAMRLGQAHGAGPACRRRASAGSACFSSSVPCAMERVVGAVGEAGIHAEGEVGGADHLARAAKLTTSGRPWPPYSGSAASAGPAALDGTARRRRLKPARRADDAVLELAALLVADRLSGSSTFSPSLPPPPARCRSGRASTSSSPGRLRQARRGQAARGARNACRAAAPCRSA